MASESSSPEGTAPRAPDEAVPPAKVTPAMPGRRLFLRGLAGGVAGGVVAGGAAGAAAGYAAHHPAPDPVAAANEAIVNGTAPAVPFHGTYQAGILPGAQRATAVVRSPPLPTAAPS